MGFVEDNMPMSGFASFTIYRNIHFFQTFVKFSLWQNNECFFVFTSEDIVAFMTIGQIFL